MDEAQAREIAYQWHGGGGSPLYVFASTGVITQDTVDEADECLAMALEHTAYTADECFEIGELLEYLTEQLEG